MALLGFNAVGRLALGQIAQSSPANVAVPRAVGTGVAGIIGANPAKLFIGVAGTGVARSVAVSESAILTGVSGVGVARSVTPLVATSVVGVTGIGLARGISTSLFVTLPPAVGIGVARAIVANPQAFFTGVAGIGLAGEIGPNPAGNPTQAAGTGIAGQITALISGGGGKKRPNTGFEPIAKRPPPKPLATKTTLPRPPWREAPALVPQAQPIPLGDRELVPSGLVGLEQQILSAQDLSDVERFLRELDQDQQDAADIADVLALLD